MLPASGAPVARLYSCSVFAPEQTTSSRALYLPRFSAGATRACRALHVAPSCATQHTSRSAPYTCRSELHHRYIRSRLVWHVPRLARHCSEHRWRVLHRVTSTLLQLSSRQLF